MRRRDDRTHARLARIRERGRAQVSSDTTADGQKHIRRIGLCLVCLRIEKCRAETDSNTAGSVGEQRVADGGVQVLQRNQRIENAIRELNKLVVAQPP